MPLEKNDNEPVMFVFLGYSPEGRPIIGIMTPPRCPYATQSSPIEPQKSAPVPGITNDQTTAKK